MKPSNSSDASSSTSPCVPTTATSVIAKPSHSLDSFLTGKEVLEAEIKWCLKSVYSNFSYHASKETDLLFAWMFPDSMVAKKFSCGEKKTAYMCCFGLAPHFEKLLFKSLEEIQEYTVLFDETLNVSTQRKQLDVLIRFWSPDINEVVTRYLNSSFMGHATSDDLNKSFKLAIEKIKLDKILQVSMDGPAVNHKFFKALQTEVLNDYNKKIIDIGTCGLHVLHNAFRKGVAASGWNVETFLKGAYYVFKDSPARMEDYLNISSTKKVGVKFCHHRWLENLPAAQRGLEIFDDLTVFVTYVEKGKIPKPNCQSYKGISDSVKDKYFKVKLTVFITIAQIVAPFLKNYQGDMPLLPFFAQDLTKLIRDCLCTFNIIKDEEIANVSCPTKLASFDINDKCLTEINKVSFGFSGDQMIKLIKARKETADKDIKMMKHEVQSFVISLVKKVLEKSPLNYSLVRNASCLDPRHLKDRKSNNQVKMKSILKYFVECGRLAEEVCDKVICEFKEFSEVVPSSACSSFDPWKSSRIDDFYYEEMYKKGYLDVWSVVKKVLLLSHGQATVESGFSVNKSIEVENLKENSYVSKRRIKDFIKFSGGLTKVVMTQELLQSAGSARQRYVQYLEENKKQKELDCNALKKRKLQEELESLKRKKIATEEDILSLEKTADDFSESAELTKNLLLITKSNALRRCAREKKITLKELSENIVKKTDEIKNC